ncbi:MAG: NACHT domain-containing protein [Candidatus Cybelea sp.]
MKGSITPSWLEVPDESLTAPPVVTRAQELPFEQLSWENFERLCLRLAREEVTVSGCWQYGARGQSQDGIDLYGSTLNASEYVVYQCRRTKQVTAAQIKRVVKDIDQGSWGCRASRIVLCTRANTNNTNLREEIERQRNSLAGQGKLFEVWDGSELSLRLKKSVELVDDFFGREWAEIFCSPDALSKLRPRLDGVKIGEFRNQLGEFYRHIFEQQDPGIPLPPGPGAPYIPLRDRYVLPDVEVQQSAVASRIRDVDDIRISDTYATDDSRSVEASTSEQKQARVEYVNREPVAAWLSRESKAILVGEPGSGKSSLLRYLILDMFSGEPELSTLAASWGTRLPIWFPFTYWTKLLSTNGRSISFKECLQRWLEQWDKGQLWPLVECVIADKRLLVVVDGVDEWHSDDSGAIAARFLQEFVESNGAAVVVTTRPYGLEKLATLTTLSWKEARLAPLSITQQQDLCSKWVLSKFQRNRTLVNNTAEERCEAARSEAIAFLNQLRMPPGLVQLGESPLILSIILYLWFQNKTLPAGRFEAYAKVISHLLENTSSEKARFITSSVGTYDIQRARTAGLFRTTCLCHANASAESDVSAS